MRFGVSDAEDLRPCLIATGLKRKEWDERSVVS
jgi:hypothetical protein